ncbi:tetratricopeptide repeat protein [Nonomuraea sp. NN258]|uniref:tetratricopeptide repeat protein n=1 Tax=Nonomuraea antri TaxID=2730852 RepID=UPI001568310E|nr:tetratricopeptide repeat protein [Nonomuraea antri]NRQ35308.1 tetratricopeptide repeat protein [Nonomuraea antri]
MSEWIERSKRLYERAVYAGDEGALSESARELDAVEAALALARGRVLHVRFLDERRPDPAALALFERALSLYQALGDARGEAAALFWVGCYHQVVEGDHDTAVPLLERSRDLADGDTDIRAEALRHLGIADHAAGRYDSAKRNLEESSRLRREIGLLPGVAANMVGLIHIALAEGRRDDALDLAERARAIAVECGAERVVAFVDEARAQLG